MTRDLIAGILHRLFDIGWNTLPWPLVALAAVLSVTASSHALLHKRQPNSALGWIAVAWILPLYGVILYGLLGVNRVRARAQQLDFDWRPPPGGSRSPAAARTRQRLVDIGDTITGTPLAGGNQVTVLRNGNEAYPRMLAAINTAKARVWLATYIFESDTCGREFVSALGAAVARGVEVCVLVDGIGERYGRPLISRLLRKANVPYARFLPPSLLPPSAYLNLRNHRKLLLVDDDTSFSGGMNIGGRHMVKHVDEQPTGTQDLHFEVIGPVSSQLDRIFARDWQFATGDTLDPPEPAEPIMGSSWCRAVVDGPDDNLDRLRSLMVAAVNNANSNVRIMSPYFLPTPDLVSAMATAVLAGIRVDVMIPSNNNLPYVHWAMQAMMPRLIARGVRFWVQPPPFSHGKLFLVDDDYTLIGSANIDARSLRLNFEVGIEIHDRTRTRELVNYFEEAQQAGFRVSREALVERALPWRLRDAAAWLMSPYL